MKNNTKLWFYLALFCGLAPLLIGVSIYIAWLTYKSDWLEQAGLINLNAGLLLFFPGIMSLVIYYYKAKQGKIYQYLRNTLLLLGILLINFPLAAFIIGSASSLSAQSQIIIENQTTAPITQFSLKESDGRQHILGDIAAGQSTVKTLTFESEGSVNYSFQHQDKTHNGSFLGYVTPGTGFTVKMKLNPQSEISIDETPN